MPLASTGHVTPHFGGPALLEDVTLPVPGLGLWAGMAWTVVSGLALSTVLTLLVVPTPDALFAERLGMRVVAETVAEE